MLFSYAFPPMQVQMTAAVFKPMAALAGLGYEVDVLCADSFSPVLPIDESLLPFVDGVFDRVFRLNPPTGLIGKLYNRSKVLSRVPDLMTVLHRPAYERLMDMDLHQYDAVMTWSPFHSINPVMVRIKQGRKSVRWIAQFSDPWAGNPLEVSRLAKLWNRRHQPRTVDTADYIVHSSAYSLDLMLERHPKSYRQKTGVIPHAFNEVLYPQRPKAKNASVVMRYAGVLYGRRSPDTFFQALASLYKRRPDLRQIVAVEFIGLVPPEMLKTPAALSLPEGTVTVVNNVSYLRSLELMYDADILLLIEANIRQNLFLPSKLSDYLGANTRIVGLVPPGASEDALKGLGCWYARPADVDGISQALEAAIDHLRTTPLSPWCDHRFRQTFSGNHVAAQFASIIEKL